MCFGCLFDKIPCMLFITILWGLVLGGNYKMLDSKCALLLLSMHLVSLSSPEGVSGEIYERETRLTSLVCPAPQRSMFPPRDLAFHFPNF